VPANTEFDLLKDLKSWVTEVLIINMLSPSQLEKFCKAHCVACTINKEVGIHEQNSTKLAKE
jgi:hypothetical protein